MKTIIIDIGTHKAEELNTLFSPSYQEFFILSKETIKLLIRRSNYRLKEIINCWRILLNKNLRSQKENYQVFAIEPNLDISTKNINRLKKIMPVVHFPCVITGHNENRSHSLQELKIFSNSLSSSLYDKKNMQILSSVYCFGFNFSHFIKMLEAKDLVHKENKIIIRMNCEGAELGVVSGVDDLLKLGFNVVSVLGSLADVRKVHGEDAYKEMMRVLDENKLSYVYFKGSDLSSWDDGIREINRAHGC